MEDSTRESLALGTAAPQGPNTSLQPPELEDMSWNPTKLSRSRKMLVLVTGIICTFNSSLGTSMPSGAFEAIANRFTVSDPVHLGLLNSLNMAGFVLGPLLFGPLSEYIGRKPVLIVSFLGYIVFMLACSASPTFAVLLVFRLLCGINAAAPTTVIAGLYADILDDPSQRGTAIAVFLTTNTLGSLFGPVVSGFASRASWRWPFWVAAMMAAPGIPLLLMLPETFAPILQNSIVDLYGLSSDVAGLMYLPEVAVGAIIALLCFCVVTEWYNRSATAGKPWAQREIYRRLPAACVAAPCMVISLMWLGWTSWESVSPAVPACGGMFFGLGFGLLFMSMLNYITDIFRPMYARLGIHWAPSVLGFIALAMGVIPFVFMFYGEDLARRSKFARNVYGCAEDG
ncbi:hypothetical protein ACJZ2D_015928 [Fusarium nematophilum]